MRVIGIDDVERFPFPSPPPKLSVFSALFTLKSIAAIVTQKSYVTSIAKDSKGKALSLTRCVVAEKVSSLGQWIAKFPIK
jgi:HrpA-like RNA helicase